MESNELKEIEIKNGTCYYVDDKIEYFDFDNILIDEILYKNILVYDISYKTLFGSKQLHVRLDEADEFVKVYAGTRYLTLLGSEKYHVIYYRIRYLIS